LTTIISLNFQFSLLEIPRRTEVVDVLKGLSPFNSLFLRFSDESVQAAMAGVTSFQFSLLEILTS